MTDIEDLERRVSALEKAQRETKESQEWMAATLGRIAAVQDDHTKVLNDHTKTLNDHTQRLDRLEHDTKEVKTDLKGLRAEFTALRGEVRELKEELPGIVGDAVREALNK